MGSKKSFISAWIMIVLGLPMFAFGTYLFERNLSMIWTGESVQATVSGHYQSRSTDFRSTIFAPIVEFNHNSTAITATSKHYTKKDNYQIGDKVTVFYDPSNPKDILIQNNFFNYTFPTIFFTIGFIPMLIGAFFFRKTYIHNTIVRDGFNSLAKVTNITSQDSKLYKAKLFSYGVEFRDPQTKTVKKGTCTTYQDFNLTAGDTVDIRVSPTNLDDLIILGASRFNHTKAA